MIAVSPFSACEAGSSFGLQVSTKSWVASVPAAVCQQQLAPAWVHRQWCRGMCSDLAAHIDGFIACVAHTVVVQSEPVKGSTADALAAAHTALEAALRLVRPGATLSALICFIPLPFPATPNHSYLH